MTWSWKVLHLRISLDYEGPAAMRGASEPVEELRKGGGHERGHSKRNDVANKGDRRRSHTTRTCTDDVRGHQQKRRSETTALREAVRHRQAVRGACPTAKDLLDLHVHRLQKKTARGSDSEAKQQQT